MASDALHASPKRPARAPAKAPAKAKVTTAAKVKAKPVKAMKDQFAIDKPRKVQSICEQSPAPRKIIGSARCSGKVSIIP